MPEASLDSTGDSPVRKGSPSTAAELFKLEIGAAPYLILFIFGGGLLALYYAGIGYFPEVSWQDALTTMALMTILGGSLLVAYGFLLFVPGAIWSEFLVHDERLRSLFWMAERPLESCVWAVTTRILIPFALFMAFCHALFYLRASEEPATLVGLGAGASLIAAAGLFGRVLGHGLEREALKKTSSRTANADIPAFPRKLLLHYLHVALAHLLLVFTAVGVAYSLDPRLGIPWYLALLPLASVPVFLGTRQVERRLERRHLTADGASAPPPPVGREDRNAGQKPGNRRLAYDNWSLLCRAVLAFVAAALLNLAALWFFYRIYTSGASPDSHGAPGNLLLLCTIIEILANLAVSVLYRNRRRQALLVSFLAALILLGAGQLLGTDAESRLPAKIMAKFGFGGAPASLVLTEEGGHLLCEFGIQVEFEEAIEPTPPPPPAGLATDLAKLADASKSPEDGKRIVLARAGGLTILSRLGSEYVLREEKRKQILALPKAAVISWAIIDSKETQIEIRDGCKTSKSSPVREKSEEKPAPLSSPGPTRPKTRPT